MIVAQERGIQFHFDDGEQGWMPSLLHGGRSAREAWEAIEESLGFVRWGEPGVHYGETLTKEGEPFRQRFVDYTPPEEAT